MIVRFSKTDARVEADSSWVDTGGHERVTSVGRTGERQRCGDAHRRVAVAGEPLHRVADNEAQNRADKATGSDE